MTCKIVCWGNIGAASYMPHALYSLIRLHPSFQLKKTFQAKYSVPTWGPLVIPPHAGRSWLKIQGTLHLSP